mmetsp:Transcript_37419/g.69178  ORF Transcript_37419/g.69178 Transcript_37419/m.69178 type:complete len:446 (+) Transcript_37419:9872-11209(+)
METIHRAVCNAHRIRRHLQVWSRHQCSLFGLLGLLCCRRPSRLPCGPGLSCAARGQLPPLLRWGFFVDIAVGAIFIIGGGVRSPGDRGFLAPLRPHFQHRPGAPGELAGPKLLLPGRVVGVIHLAGEGLLDARPSGGRNLCRASVNIFDDEVGDRTDDGSDWYDIGFAGRPERKGVEIAATRFWSPVFLPPFILFLLLCFLGIFPVDFFFTTTRNLLLLFSGSSDGFPSCAAIVILALLLVDPLSTLSTLSTLPLQFEPLDRHLILAAISPSHIGKEASDQEGRAVLVGVDRNDLPLSHANAHVEHPSIFYSTAPAFALVDTAPRRRSAPLRLGLDARNHDGRSFRSGFGFAILLLLLWTLGRSLIGGPALRRLDLRFLQFRRFFFGLFRSLVARVLVRLRLGIGLALVLVLFLEGLGRGRSGISPRAHSAPAASGACHGLLGWC